VTPARFDNLAVTGAHEIVLSLAGYHERSIANIQLPEGAVDSVHHIFSLITHPLTVLSDPPEATVALDGRILGETPRSVPEVSQGRHELLVRKTNYHTESRDIDVPVPGNMITVQLKRLAKGILVFRIKPYGDIVIDGQLRDRSVQYKSYELDQGIYHYDLRNEYYGSHLDSVKVVSGQADTVTYDFEQARESP
jgi:hypothetical protein